MFVRELRGPLCAMLAGKSYRDAIALRKELNTFLESLYAFAARRAKTLSLGARLSKAMLPFRTPFLIHASYFPEDGMGAT